MTRRVVFGVILAFVVLLLPVGAPALPAAVCGPCVQHWTNYPKCCFYGFCSAREILICDDPPTYTSCYSDTTPGWHPKCSMIDRWDCEETPFGCYIIYT